MKILLLSFIFFVLSFHSFATTRIDTNSSKGIKNDSLRLEIYQPNSAYAYSRCIIISDSALSITFIGGLINEKPKMLWSTKLKKSSIKKVAALLELCGLDTIGRVYRNPGILDGMVVAFKIVFHGKEKKVQFMNVWITPFYNLAFYINELIPKKYKMDLNIPRSIWDK